MSMGKRTLACLLLPEFVGIVLKVLDLLEEFEYCTGSSGNTDECLGQLCLKGTLDIVRSSHSSGIWILTNNSLPLRFLFPHKFKLCGKFSAFDGLRGGVDERLLLTIWSRREVYSWVLKADGNNTLLTHFGLRIDDH
ncbi:hypothetical protein TNCT_80171 [Trichonephila clavata]|uniref:Uncharacterized protein n=1 Tax=Trichonephila clavata TaxID=2740835 RepID=A0A8X6G913_TRICU|nr:hypothetical protein TNCT_80171 [Trichonephila clavata]